MPSLLLCLFVGKENDPRLRIAPPRKKSKRLANSSQRRRILCSSKSDMVSWPFFFLSYSVKEKEKEKQPTYSSRVIPSLRNILETKKTTLGSFLFVVGNRDRRRGYVEIFSRKKFFYLVDPASSHMLVSKTKPCICQYKQLLLWNCEWLIKSVIVYLIVPYYLDNRGNSRANTCEKSRLFQRKGCIY